MENISYSRHRFPPAIIQHTVWLYFRISLSYLDVEDMLTERGIGASYETIRRWVGKFGGQYAKRLWMKRPKPRLTWHNPTTSDLTTGDKQFRADATHSWQRAVAG